jgi:small subunit ribosomal protein S3
MVLRWLVQKVLKMEEFFINFQSRYCYALAEAHTTYGRMGIKVWIMKVRFTERDLSPLAGMDKKQAGGKGGDSPREINFNKGGKPDARKESF